MNSLFFKLSQTCPLLSHFREGPGWDLFSGVARVLQLPLDYVIHMPKRSPSVHPILSLGCYNRARLLLY